MEGTGEFTARASLAVIGSYFMQQGLWAIVHKHVHIKQKVIQHEPLDKLLDCFVSILAGGRGLCQIQTLVQDDAVLRRAFGPAKCADYSTVNDTLNTCTATNGQQMNAAATEALQSYGQCCQHDYSQALQVLDLDLTGWPGGRRGEGVERAYFADQTHRRGRQLGRVLATRYQEVVCDRLYPGKRQLATALPDLVLTAEAVLGVGGDSEHAQKRRENTVWRVDGGGGSEANLNWLLARDYRLMIKLHNAKRAAKLARSVSEWLPDPTVPDRAIGWVQQPTCYGAATRQLAIRHRKPSDSPDGSSGYAILVFNLSDDQLATLLGRARPGMGGESERLFNALHFYDLRGGGTETQFRGDKQGLGLSHRHKRRFDAQVMLVALGQLAHNVVIWTRNRLAHVDARFAHYGVLRIVRDVYQVLGCLEFDDRSRLVAARLNPASTFATAIQAAFPLSL